MKDIPEYLFFTNDLNPIQPSNVSKIYITDWTNHFKEAGIEKPKKSTENHCCKLGVSSLRDTGIMRADQAALTKHMVSNLSTQDSEYDKFTQIEQRQRSWNNVDAAKEAVDETSLTEEEQYKLILEQSKGGCSAGLSVKRT